MSTQRHNYTLVLKHFLIYYPYRRMKQKFLETPFANAILFSIFWAIQIFISKLAYREGIHPVVLTNQSTFFTLSFITVYLYITHSLTLPKLSRGIMLSLLAAGAIHTGLGAVSSYMGVSLTSAVNAGFLVRFSLITTTIFAWIFLKEQLTFSKIIAISIMLLGSYFMSTNGASFIPHVGDLLIILGCIFWSIGNVWFRKILKETSIDAKTASIFRPLGAVPLLLIATLFSFLYPEPLKSTFSVNIFDPNHIQWSVLNSVFTTLNLVFLNRTLKVATASYMTMMGMITPIVVSILAVTILRETILPLQIFGALLILMASIVTQFIHVDKK